MVMLLQGLSFISKLEVLSSIPSGTKCTGNCEACLIRRVKDALSSEFEVSELCHKCDVLSETEFTAVMRDLISRNCRLCVDFGCSCGDVPCENERFGVAVKATTDTTEQPLRLFNFRG